jgi:hypothetical protein
MFFHKTPRIPSETDDLKAVVCNANGVPLILTADRQVRNLRHPFAAGAATSHGIGCSR